MSLQTPPIGSSGHGASRKGPTAHRIAPRRFPLGEPRQPPRPHEARWSARSPSRGTRSGSRATGPVNGPHGVRQRRRVDLFARARPGPGRHQPAGLCSRLTRSSVSSAAGDNGILCSQPPFMRSSGMGHSPACRSISLHVAQGLLITSRRPPEEEGAEPVQRLMMRSAEKLLECWRVAPAGPAIMISVVRDDEPRLVTTETAQLGMACQAAHARARGQRGWTESRWLAAPLSCRRRGAYRFALLASRIAYRHLPSCLTRLLRSTRHSLTASPTRGRRSCAAPSRAVCRRPATTWRARRSPLAASSRVQLPSASRTPWDSVPARWPTCAWTTSDRRRAHHGGA